uniref:DEP domain containing 1B n=1 Tax=Cyprinus carpio TaxID=7962 RepID=A0A8C1RM14_CYPCA
MALVYLSSLYVQQTSRKTPLRENSWVIKVHHSNCSSHQNTSYSIILLQKFLKNHVIEDVKGRFGKEDFVDSGHLYRFPPQSPLKPVPVCPPVRDHCLVPRIPRWDDYEEMAVPEKIPMKPLMNSESWNKRHSIAIGEIWKSMTLTHLQTTVLGLQFLDGLLDAELLSPKHIVHNVFGVNTQGIVQQSVAVEALQVCCLLLPPANRRKLQLLMHLMAKVCANPSLPPLNNTIGARTLMVQTFSRCILGFADEVDLDELLATKLVTFMIDNHDSVLKGPSNLRKSVEEHLSHIRRAQVSIPRHTDTSMASPPHSFCRQISREEFELQRVSGSQETIVELLENIIQDKNMSIKDKKKKLKQFQRSHPDIYSRRFPAAESEEPVFPERPQRLKAQLMFLTLKKPFQPFQRSWSFRLEAVLRVVSLMPRRPC